jgi:hypothetical protein
MKRHPHKRTPLLCDNNPTSHYHFPVVVCSDTGRLASRGFDPPFTCQHKLPLLFLKIIHAFVVRLPATAVVIPSIVIVLMICSPFTHQQITRFH